MTSKKTAFDPFANEAQVLQLGRLMLENRLDRITLSGDLDITADKPGLEAARQLYDVLGEVVRKLEAQALPDQLPAPVVKKIDNPFA